MGIFDDTGLIDNLLRLSRSPGAKFIGNQFKQALPFGAGPIQSRQQYGNPGGGMFGASAGGLGGMLRHVGSRAGAGQNPNMPQQGSDPLMDLYAQLLEQLQAPVNMPTGIDTANLMKQVQDAINPIYDQREKQAKDQTGRATKDVQQMYRALANDYERLAPQQVAQANEAQKQVEQLYGQLRSNIEGDYSRISEEQGDLFKQLGIEDALPAVLDDQDDQVLEAQRAASENQAQQQQRYMDQGQADATYYREGSPNAVMTGNETSSNLLADLQDYLQQVEAERTSGIQSGYMDQLNQANSQLAQQQQAAQGEAGRRQEMLWQMLQGQLNAKQQPTELNADSFMQQLPPEVQRSVADSFTRLQRSPEAVYGKTQDPRNPVPGTFVETTPQWYMAQADEMLRRGEIDPTTHQALLMYLQLAQGK